MRITRTELTEMVAAEVRRRIRELREFSSDSEDSGEAKRKPKKHSTSDASNEPTKKGKPPAGAGPQADVGSPSVDPDDDDGGDPKGPAVDGDQPDPEGDSEDDADAVDADGKNGEEPSGAINDEISGKTVQAITIEPKSQLLPGAKEVVIAFNESTDALRIEVTSTGEVKFFWRGQLHDLP